ADGDASGQSRGGGDRGPARAACLGRVHVGERLDGLVRRRDVVQLRVAREQVHPRREELDLLDRDLTLEQRVTVTVTVVPAAHRSRTARRAELAEGEDRRG